MTVTRRGSSPCRVVVPRGRDRYGVVATECGRPATRAVVAWKPYPHVVDLCDEHQAQESAS